MSEFVEYLTRTEHFLIMLGVWVSIGFVRRMLPCLEQNRSWLRVLPVLPILLCSFAVWLPGLTQGGTFERVLLGLVLGAFCGHAHKLAKQTFLGNHKRIRDHPQRL
jgi:hypothetical protein